MSKTNEDFIKEACELMLCNDILRGLLFVPSSEETQKILKNVERKLKEIKERPRAQKIGHWEYVQYDSSNIGNYHCSECRETFPVDCSKWNFCPNCGAKMVEPQERENQND